MAISVFKTIPLAAECCFSLKMPHSSSAEWYLCVAEWYLCCKKRCLSIAELLFTKATPFYNFNKSY